MSPGPLVALNGACFWGQLTVPTGFLEQEHAKMLQPAPAPRKPALHSQPGLAHILVWSQAPVSQADLGPDTKYTQPPFLSECQNSAQLLWQQAWLWSQ